MIVRRLARPLLAAIFVAGGLDALRNPESKAKAAQPFLDKAATVAPLPADTATLVKVNGGVQVGAGSLLALGRFPRLSALALAGSLVPTTLAGHSFWELQDPQARAGQRIQFLKNLSMLGGLLLAAMDNRDC